MRRVLFSILFILGFASLWAAPAYRGWQTKTLTDGTTIKVRLVGDEFYSYWETEDGEIALEQKDGTFVKSKELRPSSEEFRARRAKNMNRRAPKVIGTKNLPPKGVVILVNFADSVMKQGHDSTLFENMCNAASGQCIANTYNNVNYGSAAQFFADQSKGAYRPQFDVFGPVTLPHPVAYYGEEGWHEHLEREIHDLYMGDFIIDAIFAADSLGCDFSQYDANNDSIVDFVYFIFAGKGQAAGGESWTIWPHNSNLKTCLYWGLTHGRDDYYYDDQRGCHLPVIDGKKINNYACSEELNLHGNLEGIGTLCHEFSHVMGLPDYYDTNYGLNEQCVVAPNDWDLMSCGNYNGDGHCPPNYNPWSKYFFGWVDPVNPGRDSTLVTLYPSGTESHNVYQINASGSKQAAKTKGLNYYVEYRDQTGWDSFTPAAGLVIWRCDFDTAAWKGNRPNNTAGEPRLTLVCSSGVMVGSLNGAGNVFPNETITAWTDGEGNHLQGITKKEDNVTCRFHYDSSTIVKPIWTDWAYYDDGNPYLLKGYNKKMFYWGIKFPANTLANDTLSKVKIFEDIRFNTQPISIYVFSGGIFPMKDNLIHRETVDPAGINGWHEITLDSLVCFDTQSNLWIMLSEEGDETPAIASEHHGERNTSWISFNGYKWHEMTDEGVPYNWMIRAYIGSSPQGFETVNADTNTKAVKVLHNGQILILRGEETYTIFGQKIK